VCESTYGDRLHESIETTIEKLYAAINRTIKRGGKVLIPAFSLGRTQIVVHYLQDGIHSGAIPRVPIYVDSPLAADISEVYYLHPECLGAGARERLERDAILGGGVVEYVREFEESLRLSARNEPMIVVASSGMCDAGRIQQHLKLLVDDPRCTVILVSYQAAGTTGRRLTEKSPTIRFLGKDWNKWMEVVHLDGFSAHADRDDFLAYLTPLVGKVGKTRLIHGEREQAEALAETLRGLGFDDVEVPQPGDRVRVG
jgi:metallo-beta-lactamase family protein